MHLPWRFRDQGNSPSAALQTTAQLHRAADLTGGELRGEAKECGCDDMREETCTHTGTQIRVYPNGLFTSVAVAVSRGTQNAYFKNKKG